MIAWLLDGPEAGYTVPLPDPGEPKRAILETYTKEYSAEYQAQALIDLARRMRPRIGDLEGRPKIVIRTSHHTHNVIGTGRTTRRSSTPTPAARRWTTRSCTSSRSRWRTAPGTTSRSYAPERAATAGHHPAVAKDQHSRGPGVDPPLPRPRPGQAAFGGRVGDHPADGTVITEEIAVADAHPAGARPFAREQYIAKFRTLADGVIAATSRTSSSTR